MTFNLSGSNSDTPQFVEVKVGEGFLILPYGYYIKTANDRAVRVGLAEDCPPDEDEEIITTDIFRPEDEVDKIYPNVSITMG